MFRLLDVFVVDYLLWLDRHMDHIRRIGVEFAIFQGALIVKHGPEEDEADVIGGGGSRLPLCLDAVRRGQMLNRVLSLIEAHRTFSPISPYQLLHRVDTDIHGIHVLDADVALLQVLLVDFEGVSGSGR